MTELGALFDMDGLLLDTERLGLLAFQQVLAPLGMTAADAASLYLTLIGGTQQDTIDALSSAFPTFDGAALHDRWRAQLNERLSAHVPLRPTVVEALTLMQDQGVGMAIVTSTQREDAVHHLGQAGLLDYMAGIVGGEDVTCGKPHPEPYQKGAALLGLPPAACVAFEDSDAGTTSALAAGCMVWQVPDLRPQERPLAVLGQNQAATLLDAVSEAVQIGVQN